MEDLQGNILVSISCITFNHAKYLRRCLDGFLMQQINFKYEILIHDDASTDGTKDIIIEYQKKYPDIIKPIIQTENQYSKGIRGINLKFNINRAKGKYVAFCEGDDFWTDPLKLHKQISLLELDNSLSACATYVNNIGEDNKIIKYARPSQNIEIYSSTDALVKFFPSLTILSRKEIYNNYDFNKINVFNSDYLNLVLICNHGNVAMMNFISGSYRIHSEGVYSKNNFYKNSLLSIKSREIILKKLFFLNKRIKKRIRKDIYLRKLKLFLYCLKNGDLLGILNSIINKY